MASTPSRRAALWNAASRADASMPESLNPRILQNDLLVEVLDNFSSSIETGTLPTVQASGEVWRGEGAPAIGPAQLEVAIPRCSNAGRPSSSSMTVRAKSRI